MQFRGDMIGIAGRRQGVAPAEAGSIIRADACGLREGWLHTAPDEPVVAQPGIQHDHRRTAPAAIDAHRVAVHHKDLPWRRVAKAIEHNRVEATTAGYHSCSQCQQGENETFCEFAPTEIIPADDGD